MRRNQLSVYFTLSPSKRVTCFPCLNFLLKFQERHFFRNSGEFGSQILGLRYETEYLQ